MRVLLPDGAGSANPMRPSFGVTEYMQEAGYRIIPVNPNDKEVLGEKRYARLEDVPEKIEMVNVFRRPEEVASVVESAIEGRLDAARRGE
jgi:predicted CoA-binding protein